MGILRAILWSLCCIGLGIFLATADFGGRTPLQHLQRAWKQARPSLDKARDDAGDAVESTRKKFSSRAREKSRDDDVEEEAPPARRPPAPRLPERASLPTTRQAPRAAAPAEVEPSRPVERAAQADREAPRPAERAVQAPPETARPAERHSQADRAAIDAIIAQRAQQ